MPPENIRVMTLELVACARCGALVLGLPGSPAQRTLCENCLSNERSSAVDLPIYEGTPGPWEYSPPNYDDAEGALVMTPGGKVLIASVESGVDAEKGAVVEAHDGRLIAAAPALALAWSLVSAHVREVILAELDRAGTAWVRKSINEGCKFIREE